MKWDPFGHLSARTLLQTWLGSLVVLQCLWLLGSLFLGGWRELAVRAALLAGLGVAWAALHPAAKLCALAAWMATAIVTGGQVHLGLALLMGMTAYVMARAAFEWRRRGASELRVGFRRRILPTGEWAELHGLTRAEQRVVVGRAAAPREIVWWRLHVGCAVLLGIGVLEIWLQPPSDSARLPTSLLGAIFIAPYLAMVDPRSQEESIRRSLRERVLPEFRRQPWLWDHARREAAPPSP
jgi:hypothetical protein